jgi:3-phosphoshikimate 1-carboxyvinyltransferase
MDIRSEPFEVPSGRVARGRVTAPPSKSHAIRALVCAALADGTSTLHGLTRCDADDVQRTIVALRTLGFAIDGDRVTGHGGKIPNPNVTLDLGGSGTAFRFLTAVAALGPGPTTLTGDESLRRRPMGSIVRPLRSLGVTVDTADLRAPIVVSGGPPRGEVVEVDRSETSQALSALLLIGPALARGLGVLAIGERVSDRYVLMTEQVVYVFRRVRYQSVVRPGETTQLGGYDSHDIAIEGDWSGAAYMIAAAAVTGGDVIVDGVSIDTLQADLRIEKLLAAYGADVGSAVVAGVRVRGADRRPLDVDLRDAPDLAPLVGALGCVATGTTRVRGAAHLRIKESDRIATVVAAARALGCEARELPDGFEIDGPAKHGGLVETKHDHRIAMAFAVAGLAIPGVVIDDPACVAKSYPGFWDDLARLTTA